MFNTKVADLQDFILSKLQLKEKGNIKKIRTA